MAIICCRHRNGDCTIHFDAELYLNNDLADKQLSAKCSLVDYQLFPEDHLTEFIHCFIQMTQILRASVYFLRSYGDHVQHFKVLQDRCCQYYVWDELFSSLNELVEFYHNNSIAKERTVFLRDPEHFARVSMRLLPFLKHKTKYFQSLLQLPVF